MTLEIVNAEGVPAPRDGTIFNAQFSDGSVTKVDWSPTTGEHAGHIAGDRFVRKHPATAR